MTKYYTPTRLSENIRETPEGFLICLNVPIARTGVMIYAEGETPLEGDEDGEVKITRDSKEVFNPDTIASFEGKAVTIRHPEEFVSPDNWSDLAKGVIQNVRRSPEKDEDGEESLIADLLITDALAIRLIKSGLREVSCGYEAEYEQTGDGKGKQTHIIGNHLALVEQGRAGESYAINDHDHKGKTTMSKLAENMKKLFAKAVDEATESEKKEKESKDEFGKKDEPKEESKDADEKMKGYDELVKMCKDMAEKLDAMAKPKDEDKKDDEKKPEDEDKKEESKDDDMAMEERLKALETAVAKLLDMQQGKDEDDMDDDESEDAEPSYGEEKESKDEDLKKSEKTGDSKKTGLEDTKKSAFQDSTTTKEVMTAEKMNEINAAFWARK